MTDIQNLRTEEYPFNDVTLPRLVLKSGCKLGDSFTDSQNTRLAEIQLNLLHVMLMYNARIFALPLFDAAFTKGYIYQSPLKTLSLLAIAIRVMNIGSISRSIEKIVENVLLQHSTRIKYLLTLCN